MERLFFCNPALQPFFIFGSLCNATTNIGGDCSIAGAAVPLNSLLQCRRDCPPRITMGAAPHLVRGPRRIPAASRPPPLSRHRAVHLVGDMLGDSARPALDDVSPNIWPRCTGLSERLLAATPAKVKDASAPTLLLGTVAQFFRSPVSQTREGITRKTTMNKVKLLSATAVILAALSGTAIAQDR